MVTTFVYIMTFIELFSFGVTIPMLGTQMIAVGGDRFILGMLGSAQCLLQFVAGPVFGSWSDSVGAKPALLLSAYGLLLSQLIFAIPHLYCYILGRIVNSCFLHGQILIKTLLTESEVTDQAAVQGKLRAVGALSFTIAPLIGGVIMSTDEGFHKLSIVCTGLSLVNVVVCHRLPSKPEVELHSSIVTQSPLRRIGINLRHVDWGVFGTLFMLRFLVETAASIYHQNLGYIFAEVFGSTPNQVGLILSFYGVSSIIVNVRMRALMRHVSDGYKCGTLGMLAAFALIYCLPYFWTYMAFIVMFVVFKTILEATWTDSIVEMADEKSSGAVNGAFQSLVQLSGFIAPLVNGYVGAVYGYSATILLSCCISLAAVATSLRLSQPKTKAD